jgi:DNA helicase HerA-like ATPase
VFFFDDAHLLFDDVPKALVERIEQVVRLTHSKGVGVYFVPQSPLDIPEGVLGQLGNRFQHALRAFTPKDQRAVRAAADTFRPNPNFSASEVIGNLGVGEALVSTLDGKGVPTIVERTLIRLPSSRLSPATTDERASVIAKSPLAGRYDTLVDREPAYEHLQARAEKVSQDTREKAEAKKREREYTPAHEPKKKRPPKRGRQRQGLAETMAKSVLCSVGASLGPTLVRGILGSSFKGR